MRLTLRWMPAVLAATLSICALTTNRPVKLTGRLPAFFSKPLAAEGAHPASSLVPEAKPTNQARPERSDNPTDGVIKFFQWRILVDPTSYFYYDRLGTAYMQKARETGDITYYELAEQAFLKSLLLSSDHPEGVSAAAHIANVYFAEHRFEDSLRWARSALTFETDDVSEFATIGDCLMNLGDYDGARGAYVKLVPSLSGPYIGPGLIYLRESRMAALDFAEGRASESIARMKHAIGAARSAGMHAENLAWTDYMLGFEYFRIGQFANAEASYQAALTDYPGYHRALAGLAELRVSERRFDEGIRLYRTAIGIIPIPTYAADLGDVYAKVGLLDDARKEYQLVEYIARVNALSQSVFNRELALFYADHDLKLNEAVKLARGELAIRKDVYTWDVLAFALYKIGQNAEAAAAISRALRLGTQDPLLLFHAGMIAYARGENRTAHRYLQRALALNPHFHIFYADLARRTLDSIHLQVAHVLSPGSSSRGH